jgi:ankyrin repeat protein
MTKDSLINDNLYLESCNGNIEKVLELINSNANCNHYYKDGNTPLIGAVMNNHNAIIEVLIFAGAKVNAKNNLSYQTALHKAVQNKNIDIVKELLNNKASVHVRDICRKSPLYFAYYNNSTEIIKLLLIKGANLDDEESKLLGKPIYQKPYSYYNHKLNCECGEKKDCGLLWCGCIDTCRNRCGLKENDLDDIY